MDMFPIVVSSIHIDCYLYNHLRTAFGNLSLNSDYARYWLGDLRHGTSSL